MCSDSALRALNLKRIRPERNRVEARCACEEGARQTDEGPGEASMKLRPEAYHLKKRDEEETGREAL